VLVNHSKAKDQFLKVAVKRMMETQLFQDELEEVSQLNSVLFTWNQELESQLAEESQAKMVTFHHSLLSELNHV
jgi:hypothetical protein